MATTYWAPLLHFYQPPVQLPDILRKVVEESYRPLLEVFEQHPSARVTVNINGVLTEMLWENGYQDVIDRLTQLAERGQLEFTGSAKYHAILPLIPEEEQRRQIRRNYLTNRHFFGDLYHPRGFFPPELCYSRDILDPVIDYGHQWILLSGVACPAPWPVDTFYKTRDGDEIVVVFRDDVLSNKIAFQDMDGQAFLAHLREAGATQTKDSYVVTAMDAETFGHHIQHWDQLFLAEVYESLEPATYEGVLQARPLAKSHRTLVEVAEEPEKATANGDIKVATISDVVDRFPPAEVVQPAPSSWSTTQDDLRAGNPYPLWKDPNNHIHKLQWQHVEICLESVQKAQEVADSATSERHAEIARGLLDQALHSCQFWWASRRPHWDVNMIGRGLFQQEQVMLNAYRAINMSCAPEETKRDYYYRVVVARDLRSKIYDQLYWD